MTTNNALDAELLARILGEYQEMPGLALTVDQACRLWGLDRALCCRVTDALIARGALRWSRGERLMLVRTCRDDYEPMA